MTHLLPTVVLDQSCAALLPRVGGLAPTFVFTRRDGPFTAPHRAAQELHDALIRSAFRPPYLLVAASFAGFTAIRFAREFPALVHGVVLVDSSHPRQSAALLATLPADLPVSPELEGFKTFLRGFGPVWDESCALLSRDHSLGDLPLIVLAAGTQQMPAALPSETKRSLIATWHALQREHAARSTTGELRIVEDTGHAIAQQAPDAVIAAIGDLLQRSKGASQSASPPQSASPGYRLLHCTAADQAWAYTLKCDAYREVVERQFGPWDEAFQRDLFDQRCWKPAISHLVIVDDQPVGLIAWEDRGDHLWLDEIQIVRDWRGRGIGSMLLRDLLGQAHALSKSVRLQVLRENHRPQALYRRLGFSILGETDTHIQMKCSAGAVP